MKAGISTYAYFWRRPTLADMIDDAARLGVQVLQVCDWQPLDATSSADRRELARRAAGVGIELELGTRANTASEVLTYLRYCAELDARLLRVLPGPSLASARSLAPLLATCEAAEVTLALETYESIRSANLLSLVRELAHPRLGICLDPSNCVAALESPDVVVSRLAPFAVNVHVKDFTFRRRKDRIGFLLIGCPLGDGMLDLDELLRATREAPFDCNAIIELWLPQSGKRTCELEAQWTQASVTQLKRALAVGGPGMASMPPDRTSPPPSNSQPA